MDKRHFGTTLRNLRRAQGLTQTDLAERLGLDSHALVSNLERGHKTPLLGHMQRVAYVFNIPIDELMHHDGATIGHTAGVGQPQELALYETSPSYTPTLTQNCAEHSKFAAQLRTLRRHAGLTQSKLARMLGLASHSHLSQLEQGRKQPLPDLLARTAACFGVLIADLLGG